MTDQHGLDPGIEGRRSVSTADDGHDPGAAATEITVKVVEDSHVFAADDGTTLWCGGYAPIDEDGTFLSVSEHRTSDRRCFYCKVAGTSYRRAALQNERLKPGVQVILRPEPTNEHDPSAIGVWDSSGKVQIGYIPADFN